MYINFQQNQVCASRSVKTVHTNIFDINRKLNNNHAFRTCFTLCGAYSFKSPKCFCKFQHFAVIIRNVSAKQ